MDKCRYGYDLYIYRYGYDGYKYRYGYDGSSLGMHMMDMYRYGYDGYMYRYGYDGYSIGMDTTDIVQVWIGYDGYSIGMDMMDIGGRAGQDCSYLYWSDTTCRRSGLPKMGLLIYYNLIILKVWI